MKKSIFTLWACLALFHLLPAQKIISGRVIEEGTKDGVPLANVLITPFGKGTTADLAGYFKITGLAAGKYEVKTNALGYTAASKTVDLTTVDSVYIEFKLKPGAKNLEEVEIVNYKVPAVSGTRGASKSRVATGAGNISGYSSQGVFSYATAYDMAAPPDMGDITADTVGNEKYRNVIKNPFSTFSIDVDDGSYALMRKNISSNKLPGKDDVRTEEFINYFEYHYPLPASPETPFNVYTEMSACPWNPANKLLHIGIQGYDVVKTEMPPSNLVFLIDVSGSMASMDKLPLVKKAFSYLVDQLTEKDRVSIVVYAGSSGLVLAPTSGNDKTKIKDALNRLASGGSTAGGAGIELAYKTAKENFIKDGNNRVILATDGDFNVGISSDDGLVKLIEEKRNDGIFLSVVGCGTGNYQDKKMEQLADHGNGYYGYMDDEAEAKRIFVKQMGATLLTIAKDVKLQLEFNPQWVKEYKLVGYENRVLKDVEFADDKKDAGELGAGSSVTALYEIALYETPRTDKKIEEKDSKLTYASFSADDILAVNIRYKKPKEDKSTLMTSMVQNKPVAADKTSTDFRFSAAVAMAGITLKSAVNKGNASFELAYALASGAKGDDKDGYRNEFCELVQKMNKLK